MAGLRWRRFAVGEVEVDGELRTVPGLLPAARDGTGVIADCPDEPLREWLTLALESPLLAVDVHGVDTAHPALGRAADSQDAWAGSPPLLRFAVGGRLC